MMRRKEFAARVWSKLMAFETSHRLLKPGSRVLAAVSGGPDSVCLAHWLSVQARKKNLTVRLVHIHHGLRGRAADGDARFVERLGEKLGLPVAIVRAPVRALAHRRDVGELHHRVGRRLDEQHPGRGEERALDRVGIVRRDEREREAEPLEHLVHEAEGAAIEIAPGHHVVARREGLEGSRAQPRRGYPRSAR